MKNIRSIVTVAAVFTFCYPYPAQAGVNSKKNFIGPSITVGNGQSIVGVGGRFNITDDIAVRPSYSFANLAGAGVTVFGGSATYDVNIDNSQIIPFVGLGMNFYTINVAGITGSSTTGFLQAGVDINLDQGIGIVGDVKVPFDSNSVLGTVLSIGGGYRF
jgi:hypothetical protein